MTTTPLRRRRLRLRRRLGRRRLLPLLPLLWLLWVPVLQCRPRPPLKLLRPAATTTTITTATTATATATTTKQSTHSTVAFTVGSRAAFLIEFREGFPLSLPAPTGIVQKFMLCSGIFASAVFEVSFTSVDLSGAFSRFCKAF